MTRATTASLLLAAALLEPAACGGDEATARVRLHNDFLNPDTPRQPPWTICQSSYQGVEFGRISLEAMSDELEVPAGLDHVLMVAAWLDPSCAVENCLPIASRNEEEVVDGQRRTIAINMPNHQGPCPPEGIQPIPEALYNRILARWPGYQFKPYAERAQNPQCLD
jgi:hypothetical protein